MRHELYPSLDEMLSPAALSTLEGRPVTDVCCRPFQSVGFSGSHLLRVTTDCGQGRHYVLKRISREWDWIMRATDDRQGREVLAWQTGLLDRLPPEIAHPVVACAVDGPGWAILMRDVSAALIPPGDNPISAGDNERFLDAMAALHATFWDGPDVRDPALGFCSRWHDYAFLSPAGQCAAGGPLASLCADGWDLLGTLVEPDVTAVLARLLEDPQPLCDALARFPQTVVHGDWKLANLGVLPRERRDVILLDWALVGSAPPGVDLAWYLAVNSARLPVPKEAAIARCRRSLTRRLGARFDECWWRPQLELSLLGGFVQLGWAKLLGAARGESEVVRVRERAELAWWSQQIRAAAKWL